MSRVARSFRFQGSGMISDFAMLQAFHLKFVPFGTGGGA